MLHIVSVANVSDLVKEVMLRVIDRFENLNKYS